MDVIPRASVRVTCRTIGDESFLMNLDTLATYSLNETAAFVWSMIDGSHTVREIADAAIERFEVGPEECREKVALLIGEFLSESLLIIEKSDD
jgi:hypothetical protein